MTQNIEPIIERLSEQQGWSQESVADMAYGFIINYLGSHYQEGFASFLRSCAHTENEPLGGEDDPEHEAWAAAAEPDLILSSPVAEEADIFTLAHRLRVLGCAVGIFTPEELTAPDGTGLDARDVEDAMIESGNDRIDFMVQAGGFDSTEDE